ncbi:unnamed protein product, partial [marine sediment metagenome]
YIAGTDPADSGSYLELTIAPSGSSVNVSFTATGAAGAGYNGKLRLFTLRKTPDLLSAGAWPLVPGYTNITALGQDVSCAISGAEKSGFYRICTRLE